MYEATMKDYIHHELKIDYLLNKGFRKITDDYIVKNELVLPTFSLTSMSFEKLKIINSCFYYNNLKNQEPIR